jgi:hypothetical protein
MVFGMLNADSFADLFPAQLHLFGSLCYFEQRFRGTLCYHPSVSSKMSNTFIAFLRS